MPDNAMPLIITLAPLPERSMSEGMPHHSNSAVAGCSRTLRVSVPHVLRRSRIDRN